ncbi:ABC transporter substrate-binding protein [Paenibacillus oceani]|uniref:Extracellular solute-binding protein n=1 Tax=Paenibacillus oceani TaxID=2772510 RepID=A0A927CA04_9BACL|nr:extracellular solute-binding protein [Paenibacillus oceani]MBD2863850.1 extracellular solute-binding protein [Paenibacillus oceani]
MRRNGWNGLNSLGAVAIAAAVLSGCSGGQTGSEAAGSEGGKATIDSGNTGQTAQTTGGSKEVAFFTQLGDTTANFDYRIGDALRKKFPDYTITFVEKPSGKDVAESIAAGVNFDIFYSSIGNFEDVVLPYDLAYDMSELVQKHAIDLSAIEPTILDAVRQASGGKLYGLPVYNNNFVLYYNKTIFDKFGVPYPNDGMTWKQTLQLSAKLTREESGVSYFGFGQSTVHTVRLNPLSIPNVDPVTNKPTVNTDPRWKTFYQTFFLPFAQDTLYQAYTAKTNKTPDLNSFVTEKNTAMFPYLSSLIYVWIDQLKTLDWDMAALPSFPDAPDTGSVSYPTYFGVVKTSKNKDAAAEVLKYMISEAFQTELAQKAIMPVLQDRSVQARIGELSPFKDKHLQAIFAKKLAPVAPKTMYDGEVATIYRNHGVLMHTGKVDLNTGLRQAEEAAQKAIDAKRK